MPAIAWETADAAIHAWIVAASGLAATHVIFEDEKGKRPEPPYISIQIDDVLPVGSDFVIKDDAPDPEDGEELRVRTFGHRTARLELQAFGPVDSGAAAFRMLVDVISALPLHYYDLDVAGVGIGGTEAVQRAPGRRVGINEPRAIAAVMLHLGSELEARGTYVERMQVTATPKNVAGDALDEVELWIPDAPP